MYNFRPGDTLGEMIEQGPSDTLNPIGVGTEMEYGTFLASVYDRDAQGRPWLKKPEPATNSYILRNYMPDHLQRTGDFESYRQYTGDGGRWYEDHQHPENARPIVWSLRKAIGQCIAGQKDLVEIFQRATQPGENGSPPRWEAFSLYARLVGVDGYSWGYHENFDMDRRRVADEAGRVDWQKFRLVAGRLATSYYSGGAGGWYLDTYHYGQKAATLGVDYSSNTLSHGGNRQSKPVINTRDTPHANSNNHLRHHVVCRDYLLDPEAHFRELGATMLSCMAIERGLLFDESVAPQHFFEVGRMVSDDLTMQHKVPRATAGKIHPLDIEESVIERVGHLADRYTLHPELDLAYALWQNVHHRMRAVSNAGANKASMSESVEAVHDKAIELLPDVVWAQKIAIIRKDYERNPQKYGSPRNYMDIVRSARWGQLEMLYDRLDYPKAFGLMTRTAERCADFMPTPEEIEAARHGTDLEGREAQRARFIRAHSNDTRAVVRWNEVSIAGNRYTLDEPAAINSQLEEYLQDVEAAQRFNKSA